MAQTYLPWNTYDCTTLEFGKAVDSDKGDRIQFKQAYSNGRKDYPLFASSPVYMPYGIALGKDENQEETKVWQVSVGPLNVTRDKADRSKFIGLPTEYETFYANFDKLKAYVASKLRPDYGEDLKVNDVVRPSAKSQKKVNPSKEHQLAHMRLAQSKDQKTGEYLDPWTEFRDPKGRRMRLDQAVRVSKNARVVIYFCIASVFVNGTRDKAFLSVSINRIDFLDFGTDPAIKITSIMVAGIDDMDYGEGVDRSVFAGAAKGEVTDEELFGGVNSAAKVLCIADSAAGGEEDDDEEEGEKTPTPAAKRRRSPFEEAEAGDAKRTREGEGEKADDSDNKFFDA